MAGLAAFAAVVAAIAAVQCIAGWIVVVRFAARPRRAPRARPPVTVLKPLHGDEPRLEQALESLCRQRYPVFQVVFGVADQADPAAGVVRRLQSRFPGRDLALVVDARQHGANPKVSNLINMLPAARHEMLVIADSDLHVAEDYLDRLVAALEPPGTGLATTLYAGLPGQPGLPARLGAAQITHYFLPGAWLARAMGRRDCLGATMALRRDTLRRVGGFAALVAHLADDNALGRLVQGLGLAVALADTVPLTTVAERRLSALFRHELRWARTIRALAPMPFAASVLQYPIFWALLALVLTPLAPWPWIVLALAWAVRAVAAFGIDRALAGVTGPLPPPRLWLLPLRELMSVAVMIVSYAGLRVEWRGSTLHADGPAK
ncbi:MAG TPA: bacteriohopanetetrol glucosamine biosynthesis glycosyltransferase HpnI, partial [Acetobacteraceae bacterium]|nr:bacteriohopanetetrol glucosamine biosynthesis glycosyltransferase HpnI [Acetobacteraceae bacterium]